LAACSPAAILDFSASINPLGPPASAIAAIQDHLADLIAYPDPDYPQLRSALGQFHGISPDWILPGNGSAELLTWACRDLAAFNATWLLTPAFGDYRRALRAFEATVLEQPIATLGGQRFDSSLTLSNLHAASSLSSVGIVLNNPHNPTGQLLSRDAILPCLDQFGLVVVDEAFMDFLPPDQQQSVVDWVQKYPNLVVLRSLTKFYSLPGLRIGYAIAHPDRLRRWQQWRDPWSVNTLAAAVGNVVVQDAVFQDQTWNWLAEAKPQFLESLANLPGLHPYSGAANFLLVKSEQSVLHLQLELLKRDRILIRDCLSFPELGDRYFRVAIRTIEENQRLLDGLTKILHER
jgi:L-threonine-O-3-phosphate decarboxylase